MNCTPQETTAVEEKTQDNGLNLVSRRREGFGIASVISYSDNFISQAVAFIREGKSFVMRIASKLGTGYRYATG